MKDDSVSLVAVGDIMLGELPLKLGHGVRSAIRKNGNEYVLEKIVKQLEGDIVFGNLEAVLSDENDDASMRSQVMRGDPDSIKVLTSAGFSILSMANNHICEHGAEAFEDTRSRLGRNDIHALGMRKSPGSQEQEPVVFEVNDKRIGFLGYSLRPEVSCDTPLYVNDESQILRDIDQYGPTFDFLIISLHWGAEHLDHPSPEQMKFGRQLIDKGANIILGHHPHVVQGIERYGNGLIVYSLGNFIFDQHQMSHRKTFIITIHLRPDALDYSITPSIIDEKDFHIEEMKNDKRAAFIGYIDALSHALEAESLDDYDALQQEYELEEQRMLLKWRKDWKRYFITHCHKFPLKGIGFIIQGFFSKRFHKSKSDSAS